MSTRVVIVGGGTAGWMTASYLKRIVKNLESVTLIESANVKPIGVGEASFSMLKLFFDALGIEENEWMPACNASYKLGIRFENWTAGGGHFYHPFERLPEANGFSAAEWWLKLKKGQEAFDTACFVVPALCEAMRSPRFLDGRIFDEQVSDYFMPGSEPPNVALAQHDVQYPYGYHFDAALLTAFLHEYAAGMGVERVVDHVVEVNRDEQGFITGLQTKEQGLLEGDLFIDCTGFLGLLINKTLGEPFISFKDWLPNDRAVAIQPPWDVEKNGVKPYTTASALSSGWAWTIPLHNRNGNGYVYCSDFIEPEEAEAELRRFVGPAADDCPANHIRMRVGRSERSWVKNCVAIGLCSGFVEPLESTGMFFIQYGLEELVNHFPRHRNDESQQVAYNRIINDCTDGVLEFLTLHYCATDRRDTPYWRAVAALDLPPALAERMEIFRSRLPGKRTIYQPFHGFEPYSWATMVLGLNHLPEHHVPTLDLLDPAEAKMMFDATRARAERLVASLPSQHEYLEQQRRMAREAGRKVMETEAG